MLPINFHTLTVENTLSALQTGLDGLQPEEVQKRLIQYGRNELKEKKKRPAWLLFFMQFKDLMIIILLAAAGISIFIGELTDTIIILVIVVLNAVIGFVQEFRTEKAIEALKKLSVVNAKVIRNGTSAIVQAAELVPGDLVVLEAGNAVPADIRLIETHTLRIDESSLTGESVAVYKKILPITNVKAPLGDRNNMAYKGTLITNGRAKGIVIATGMTTELGKIADLLQQDSSTTPLKQRLTAFGKNLTYIILLICTVIFIAGWLRGEDVLEVLLISISLAIAAIPEAMPALMTVALAMGAKRMAKNHALVRKLPAVETLGSVSYICSDKTGTLTLNQMHVEKKFGRDLKLDQQDHTILHISMALNHDVQVSEDQVIGESTEKAIVQDVLSHVGLPAYHSIHKQFPRKSELPFDSERKCMTTVHNYNDQFLVVCKGAPESIAAIINSEEDRKKITAVAEEWAKGGLRVLAFAYKVTDEIQDPVTIDAVEKDLLWVGITGIIDPPRKEVSASIADCRVAGIQPVMITGDHPATAMAIAQQIGIFRKGDFIYTGEELDQLDDNSFAENVENTTVYARVSPEQKIRIVKMLQHKNHFVAMTGDGVNDAPSIQAANIGVAMGISGTDVSKEAADMILLDDNYSTIVKAVEEGRRIYDNIRKFVKYILTCNSAEIWTIFLAPLIGLPIPLLPIHILWINLVTDGLPGIALAGEKAEADIMKRPPRPSNENLFSQGLGTHILWVGMLMAGLTLAIQAWEINQNNPRWQTMVFTSLSLLQMGHALAVRSERTFLYQQGFFSNKPMLGSILLTFLLQLAVIYLPFMNELFRTQPLSLSELAVCVAAAVIIFHVVEAEKWVRRRMYMRKAEGI